MEPYNVERYREAARRKLPKAIFDFVDGGAEDEVTMQANREAFSSLRLRYRVHESHAPVDLSTTLCGQPMAMPILLSPVGNVGMMHPSGDLAAARVAAKLGLIMVMSGGASYTIEEVGSAADPRPWYQLYPWVGRDFYGEIMDRAAASGFTGLVVTVDTPGVGNRERDVSNAFSMPPRLTRRNAWEIGRHPGWTADVLKHRRVVVKIFDDDERPPITRFVRQANLSAAQMARTLTRPTWDDLEWMRARWQSGPFGIKGIVDPRDARRAVDIGADVIWVSNHGGRQLDTVPSTMEALPAIVAAVAGDAEIVVDGGIRRGTDVLKALCLGARAVGVGRAWVYGLAAGGAPGVEGVLHCLQRELGSAMNLLGEPSVHGLTRSYVTPAHLPLDATSWPNAGDPRP